MNENNITYSKSDVQIDELNLDRECVNLPSTFLKYAHLAVDAKRSVDDLKNELEVVEADLSKQIRADPEKFGLEKETEKAVSSAVLLHPHYRKALAKLSNAKHAADLAQAVVSAMEHKKRSLTLLVELHGMGYFANPKISRRGHEAVEEMTKERTRRPFHHKEQE